MEEIHMSYNNHTYRRNLILNLINHLEPISRKELIELTDYRPASITDILNELLEENLITKTSDKANGPGRKRSMLAVNKAYLCAVAVTFSDDSITVLLSQFDGKILKKENRRILLDPSNTVSLHQISNAITNCIDGVSNKMIVGIGIVGVTHFTSDDPYTVWPKFNEWLQDTLKPHLEKKLLYPVAIFNDMPLPILAEQRFGKAYGSQDFLCVELGETISSYFCCSGIPISGSKNMAGKLGHTIIDYHSTNTSLCSCGKAGCLDLTASYSALIDRLSTELEQGTQTALHLHQQSNKNEITNCWFDGTLYMPNKHTFVGGGILATSVLQSNVLIENCLNTGRFICNPAIHFAQLGGIAGRIAHNANIHMRNCVSAGTVDASTKTEQITPLIAYATPATKITIDSSYYTNGMQEPEYGDNFSGKATLLQNAEFLDLDYESFWSIDANGMPYLKSFHDLSYCEKKDMGQIVPDTSWYDPRLKSYTLYTAEELFGFSLLSKQNDFFGKTIYLGADITCNSGSADTWNSNEPENVWNPIQYFAGTFDGQGHTISGIYIHTNTEISGLFAEANKESTIQNFRLLNSYIYSSSAVIGSVAGRSNGIIRNIYSNAILCAETGYSAGIVGQTTTKEKSITALSIRKSLEENDRMCTLYAKDFATRIGVAIANAVNLLNPDMIILQGVMLELGDYFVNKLKETIQDNTLPAFGTLDIRISDKQKDTLSLGAIAEICNIYLRKNDYPWVYQLDSSNID